MSTTRFDLVDIIRTIERRKRFIITVTLASLILGLAVHFIRAKKYEAKAAFFVTNPIYSDRSSIFAGADSRYTDYFGDEDDIDRVIALAESDTITSAVIKNSGYDQANKLDLNNPNERNKLKLKFKKSLNIKRTEYKLLELYFTDGDPALAANVANEAVKQIEQGYRSFYNSRKLSVYNSISNKLVEIDSSINSLTDTLSRLRTESGIYDIISPNRQNLVLSTVKGNGKDLGRYIEVIQNVSALKDLLVTDRVRYISLLNQYSTGVQPNEITLLHSITMAKPPIDAAGPGLFIVLAACFFMGLFFSIVYVLLTTYYREVVLEKR
ncbi:MAG TPA: Wzz/FepE/Etk N-terminal domain-containing protein [Flavipsychrobacter sp.]|nr:Wzz/FepE/Etk N-terminal domain-containing protein [Flavipsychrobacter sp.]